MLSKLPFQLEVLPSAIMDIVRGRVFYENIEVGLGAVFAEYIVAEIDKMAENAGIDVIQFGYYCRFANRFHQNIYYKMDSTKVTVWRVLDQRFNPRRIESSLKFT